MKTCRYAGEFKKGEAVEGMIKKLSFALFLKRYCLQEQAAMENHRWMQARNTPDGIADTI
jgi:hypothetical protein